MKIIKINSFVGRLIARPLIVYCVREARIANYFKVTSTAWEPSERRYFDGRRNAFMEVAWLLKGKSPWGWGSSRGEYPLNREGRVQQ